MAMDVESEIRDLKRRVDELEGSFGFLTRQVQGVHKDLLEFEAKTEERLGRLESKVDALDRKIDGRADSLDRKIDTKIDGLAKALTGIVGDAIREAASERGGKR